MFNKSHLAGIIAILAVHDLYTNIQLIRVLKRFQKSINENVEGLQTQAQQITYLCYLLEKFDIPLDKFDAIALTNPIVP